MRVGDSAREKAAMSDTSDQLPGTVSRLGKDLQMLAMAVGTLVALLLVANVTAAWVIIRNVDSAIERSRERVDYAVAINDAALNAKGIANDERGFLLTGEQNFLAEMEMRTLLAREAFANAARAGDDTQYLAVSEAYQGFEAWLESVRSDVAAYEAGEVDAATAASLGPTRDLRKANEESLARAQSLADDGIQTASRSVSTSWSSSVLILLGYMMLAVLVGLGIAVWMIRAILPSARRLRGLAQETDVVRAV
jgi:methyl-accepting chemotaxis protein